MSENLNRISYFEDCLAAELKQMIFKLLDASDLLNLSLTSKSMNEIIGQSHDCMNKMWIKFYPYQPKDLESLKLTSRNYEKLKVIRVKNSSDLMYILDLQQAWRKVLIFNTEFINVEFYMNFIESFSESVEELEISDILIRNIVSSEEVRPLNFPNLKRIMFRNVVTKAMEGFIGSNKKLENASFDIVQPIEGKMPLDEFIVNFLRNNPSLVHLQLGPHYIKSLFNRQEELTINFDLNLKKLLLKFPVIHDPARDALPIFEPNVCNFMGKQLKVDWIMLQEVAYDSVLNVAWNQMPSIRHISLQSLDGFHGGLEFSMRPNEKIVQLDFLSRQVLISQLRKLLAATPCLKILSINALNRFMMDFIAKNTSALREIRYKLIEPEVEETYEELKASMTEGNRNITLKKVSFRDDESNPFLIDPKFWSS